MWKIPHYHYFFEPFPEDPHDPEDLRHAPHLVLVLARALHVGKYEGHEIRNNSQQVYHIHPLLYEVPLLGRGDKSDPVLDGEPGNEDCLRNGEISVFIGLICLWISHLECKYIKFHPQKNICSQGTKSHTWKHIVYYNIVAIFRLLVTLKTKFPHICVS